MKKHLFAFILLMFLALSIDALAMSEASNSKSSGGGLFMRQGASDSSNAKARPVKAPKQPPVNYIGYAVSGEDDFELAELFIVSSSFTSAGSKVKGMISIGKPRYRISEAVVEYDGSSLVSSVQALETEGIGLEEDAKKPPAPKKIKSFSGKIVKESVESESNEVKVETVGEIRVSMVEKEVSEDRTKPVMHGIVTTDSYKYDLYLELKNMRPEKPKGGRPPAAPERPEASDASGQAASTGVQTTE